MQTPVDEHVKSAFRTLLSSFEGRSLLCWLLSEAKIHETCFRQTERSTCFLLGTQSLGLQVLAKMTEADPEAWVKITEHRRKENA